MSRRRVEGRAEWGRGALVLVLIALSVGAVGLAWREWQMHDFEARLLAMEVDNRTQLAEVYLAFGQPVPAPDLAVAGGMRRELRARWWLVFSERSGDSAQRRQLWQRARDELRAAVLQRPDSAFGWASLAAVKSRLGSIDHEFADAFARAIQLGGNELRIQRQLLGVLMRYPERTQMLSEREGRELARRIDRRDPYLLIRLASRYHATAWACADVHLGPTMQSFCREQGFSPLSTATP